MLVKVQVSIDTNQDQQQVLVYNEDKSYQWVGPASEDVLNEMKGRLKVFFEASLTPDPNKPGGKLIELNHEVEEQGW